MHRMDKLVLVGVGIGAAYAAFMFWGVGVAGPQPTGPVARPRPANATPQTPAERAAERKKAVAKLRSNLEEVRPVVGTNLELNQREITFCLAEAVRIDASRTVVSGAEDEKRFDAIVKDYNSRCANYRYRQRAYDAAKSNVDKVTTALKSEGIARFERQ